jgi:hypothetical protein
LNDSLYLRTWQSTDQFVLELGYMPASIHLTTTLPTVGCSSDDLNRDRLPSLFERVSASRALRLDDSLV